MELDGSSRTFRTYKEFKTETFNTVSRFTYIDQILCVFFYVAFPHIPIRPQLKQETQLGM